jgi:choloylglycine hydrolase
MNKKIVGILISMLLIGTVISTIQTVSACTSITAIEDDFALVGQNKDWWDLDMFLRIQPPEDDKNGYLILEGLYPLPWDPDFRRPFTALNDKGLFFDALVAPLNDVSFDFSKPLLLEDPTSYIIEEFSTVSEVIEYFESHNLYFLNFLGLNQAQMFFADKTGNSAIFEGDEIILKNGDFQVCTNFYQSNPDLGGYPCWRYDTAVSMMENMTEFSVDYFKSILNATHQELYYQSQYSGVYDLNSGIVYLHHFYDYENMIEFNLEDEFLKGEQSYYYPSLFEPIDNQAPNKPNPPIGSTNCVIDKKYVYKFDSAIDPDNDEDEIYYKFDWGDGKYSNWLTKEWFDNEYIGHIWEKSGNYNIRIKARDIYGKESDWSDSLLEIFMGKKVIGQIL